MPGCVASVQHSLQLAGEDLSILRAGELSTSTETALLGLNVDGPRWGVLWAQVVCPLLPDVWPLGQSEYDWGGAEGITWMISAAEGEGDSGEANNIVTVHLPPSQRAAWRPLALLQSSVVEIFLRDAGCAVQYVYKGTRHPSAAARCEGDHMSHEIEFMLPPPELWYTPPDDDGRSFQTTSIIRWLLSYAHSSKPAQSMLIGSDAPWATEGYGSGVYRRADGARSIGAPVAWHAADGLLTTSSECIHGRCAKPLAECYRDSACRQSWNAFTASHGRVPWNQTAVFGGWEDGRRSDNDDTTDTGLQRLIECFATRCTCQARDSRPHAVRFTDGDGLTNAEVASVLELATSVGKAQRRAFGIHDGGLSSPHEEPLGNLFTVAQGHRVTFLHHRFATELPVLHAKLVALAWRAHDESDWRLINKASLSVRTMELLEYERTSDSLGWHVDEQSAVTLLIMLSNPQEDFQGAELQHEVRGHSGPVVAHMRMGDVTAYRSHQAHRVTPLTSGQRRVMAVEFWHDAPGRSPIERPHRRYGQCPF